MKYPSFANWVQQRKRHRSISAAAAGPECGADKVTGLGGSSVRWWEGVVDSGEASFDAADTARPSGLQLHLPGGVRMEITAADHLGWAAQLLKLLAPGAGPGRENLQSLRPC